MNPHADRDRSEGPHVHEWARHQNVTTKGYVMPAYEACACGAARPTHAERPGEFGIPPVDVPGRWMTDAELAEKDATIAELRAEVERLAYLLGSFGNRCTCTMIAPQTHIQPAEWEQDPWCPMHPDVDQIRQEFDRRGARLERIEALFSGGPDTSCRTVWDGDLECVSVPLAGLRDALDGEGA